MVNKNDLRHDGGSVAIVSWVAWPFVPISVSTKKHMVAIAGRIAWYRLKLDIGEQTNYRLFCHHKTDALGGLRCTAASSYSLPKISTYKGQWPWNAVSGIIIIHP